jgi:arsenite methyltransferase
MATQNPIHQEVQEFYGKVARKSGSCCGPATGSEKIQNDLYPVELLTGIPTEIVNGSAGSGDPISLAQLKPGETVLDLGSGGGLDCFLAAKQVDESGRVIGVDMTPDMLKLARSNAARMKVRNVEFREGFLESMPVDDASVDVIISNCVINLSPDKPQVLREMFRALKLGGRIALSDMVTNRALTDEQRNDKENWCACTSGALQVSEYKEELRKAGFTDIRIEPNVEAVLKAIDSGQARVPQNMSKEEVKAKFLEDSRNLENVGRTLILPHKITASKSV